MGMRLAGGGIRALAIALTLSGCAKKPIQMEKAAAAPRPPALAEQARGSMAHGETARARIQELLAEAFKPVYFPFDRADLTEDSKRILARAGDLLKQETGVTVLIQGNTDERGTEEYNLALGQRRAAVVRDYLVSYGVQSSRLRLLSYGEEKPARPGHGESDWALNRRDEFQVTF